MIPTRYKNKLPKDLSYPLGAQTISDALAGVPQFDSLVLMFRDRPMNSATTFRSMLKAGTPTTVLEVSFDRPSVSLSSSDSMIERGWYDKHWEIVSYPVLRQHRNSAHNALIDYALPHARKWLRDARTKQWEDGYRRIKFLFDPRDGKVASDEFGEVLS